MHRGRGILRLAHGLQARADRSRFCIQWTIASFDGQRAHQGMSVAIRPLSLFRMLPTANPSVPRVHRPEPPPLPAAKLLQVQDCWSMEYIDIAPATNNKDEPLITYVLVHGAPGSYHDFRHFIPLLQDQQPHARIIGINLPGFGGSRVIDDSDYIEHISALPAAKLTFEAIAQLCANDKNIFLIGHSFGGHMAINLAAFNEANKGNKCKEDKVLAVRGLVLLASAGCRPHRVMRPKENAIVVNLLRSTNPFLSWLMPAIVKSFYVNMLRFAGGQPRSHYVAGVVRAGTTDFAVIREHVEAIRATVPSFHAWSASDEFMETAIPRELARLSHPGPSFEFIGGGHNIQKTRADFLVQEVTKWTQRVLGNDGVEYEDTLKTVS